MRILLTLKCLNNNLECLNGTMTHPRRLYSAIQCYDFKEHSKELVTHMFVINKGYVIIVNIRLIGYYHIPDKRFCSLSRIALINANKDLQQKGSLIN